MNQFDGLSHVALTVSDLSRSEAWYVRVLGLARAFSEEGPERKAVVMGTSTNPTLLGLVEFAAGDRSRFDPTRTGLDHVGLSVASKAEIDAWALHLDGLGVVHSGVAEVPPGAMLNFKDPDGIALTFFWRRDVTGAP